VVASTGVYPSPEIDLTSINPDTLVAVIPPAFIYYEDTDSGCAKPLFAPLTATNLGPQQVWPPTVLATNLTELLLSSKYAWPVQEILSHVRVNTYDTASVAGLNGLFFYQPLTPTDTAAFDSMFTLGEDAYNFMGGGISITGHDGLLPVLDDIKKKKKKGANL
jgi:hypothetical protein